MAHRLSELKHKRKFPIGLKSFAELVSRDKENQPNFYFVDKTIFIRHIIESSHRVFIFPRIPGSCKSMNLDMLKCFFDIRQAEENRKLFQGLKIENELVDEKEPCMNYQGQFPVVFLDFNILTQDNFSEMFSMFKKMISELYRQHQYLLTSSKLSIYQKTSIQNVINLDADDATYKYSLQDLTKYLHNHYGKKVIVLIDGYDTPAQHITRHDQHKKKKVVSTGLSPFQYVLNVFLGEVVKGNDACLEKCVMVGLFRAAEILRLPSLDNISAFTVLDRRFSDSFGFTKTEVWQLTAEVLDKNPEAEKFSSRLNTWYNGYRFSDVEIFMPLSVLECLKQKKFSAYWLNSTNHDLVRSKLLNFESIFAEHAIIETIALLISGNVIKKSVYCNLTFDHKEESADHLWVFLISKGYLKINTFEQSSPAVISCSLAIPNFEIRLLYESIFKAWALRRNIKDNSLLMDHLREGNITEFRIELEKFFKTLTVTPATSLLSAQPTSGMQFHTLPFFKAEEKKRPYPQGVKDSDDEILSSDKEKPVIKAAKTAPGLSKQPSGDDSSSE